MKTPALLVGLFVIALHLPSALADRVIPDERVETRLRARQDPGSEHPIVGYLYPQQSAEYVRSVPYWYEIRLADGTPGYVSKAWSQVVPDATSTATVLRIGEWNIKKLGHGNRKDIPLVAQVIETDFDVLAVVEVMQKAGGHPGYDALLTALGSGWLGMVTADPRPNTNAGHAEFYAILYRPNLVGPCADWSGLVYYSDNDGGGTMAIVDQFSREPAFGCLAVTASNGSVTFDFMLAAYHARWAEGDIEDISEEVSHLDEVFAAMAAAQPGEDDLIVFDFFISKPLPFNLHLLGGARI